MTWTEENVARLKQMWSEGYSGGEIGKALGITRNAVIGKIHRLGFETRQTPTRRVKFRIVTKPLRKEPCKPGSVSLMALESGMCRWPMGDPKDAAFGFCGCDREEGSSYCALHRSASINTTRTIKADDKIRKPRPRREDPPSFERWAA